MKTVVILGAGGRIGEAAARAFLADGWTVKGVARGARSRPLAAGVEPVEADAYDLDALKAACEGADVVLHALNPLYTEWSETVMPMARNVVAAAEATGATLMLPGNVYNFGHGIRMAMREDAAPDPSTEKARIRIALENLLRERAEAGRLRAVVLRAGDFYGGERPGTWHDLMILAKLRQGKLVWPGPMDCPHAFAYLPDLGRAFAALAACREALSAFEVVNFPGHTQTGDRVKALAEELSGMRLSRRGLPWPLLRAAGLFMPMMREVAIMSYLWRTPHSLDGAKFARLLPEFVATTEAEALAATIEAQKLWPDRARAA